MGNLLFRSSRRPEDRLSHESSLNDSNDYESEQESEQALLSSKSADGEEKLKQKHLDTEVQVNIKKAQVVIQKPENIVDSDYLETFCEHKKLICKIFCTTCRTYICENCEKIHSGHDVKEEQKKIEDIRKTMVSWIKDLATKKKDIVSKKETVNMMLHEQTQNRKDVEKALNNRHGDLLKLIQTNAEKRLSVVSIQRQIILDKYMPIRTMMRLLSYIHKNSHRLRKMLKKNDPWRVIVACRRLKESFPVSEIGNDVTQLRIEYPFKRRMHSEKITQPLWALRCYDQPFDITDIISVKLTARLDNSIKFISMNNCCGYTFLSNSYKIVKYRQNAGRMVAIDDLQIENSHFTAINKDMILVCRGNGLIEVNLSNRKESKIVKSFADFYPQACFISKENEILVCLTPKPNFGKSEHSNRSVVLKLNGEHSIVRKIDMDSNGYFFFEFPIRCSEHSISNEIYIIDRTGPAAGKVMIFTELGEFLKTYDGRQILGNRAFFPTDLICLKNGFTAITDCRNNVIHILDELGEVAYFIQTKHLRGYNMTKPIAVSIDADSVYVYSKSSGVITVIKNPDISAVFEKQADS